MKYVLFAFVLIGNCFSEIPSLVAPDFEVSVLKFPESNALNYRWTFFETNSFSNYTIVWSNQLGNSVVYCQGKKPQNWQKPEVSFVEISPNLFQISVGLYRGGGSGFLNYWKDHLFLSNNTMYSTPSTPSIFWLNFKGYEFLLNTSVYFKNGIVQTEVNAKLLTNDTQVTNLNVIFQNYLPVDQKKFGLEAGIIEKMCNHFADEISQKTK